MYHITIHLVSFSTWKSRNIRQFLLSIKSINSERIEILRRALKIRDF